MQRSARRMRSRKFRAHLQQLAPSLPNDTALGREAYLFFLRKVALNPFTLEELLAMGRQEWARAVAFEVYEKNRNQDIPPLKIAATANVGSQMRPRKNWRSANLSENARFFSCPIGCSTTRCRRYLNFCAVPA